ncbi:MAG: TonB-dependent receptor [Gammaproteobacteria bacterium]|nr:TonB-dependent receptor [Gammaproteobacteria bacterium]
MRCSSKKSTFRRSILCSSIAFALLQPGYLIAQDDEDIEEVVVTGSYIRNSSFTGASPIDTLQGTDIQNAGTTNISSYMRDLVYTANTDVVSNVLAGPGGTLDGVSGFNLRGLGSSSTLTLFDGSRFLNTEEIAAVVPDIALERMEIILDGGAALYGADAVAGVVNIIPIKRYDGLKIRSSYGGDDNGGYEEMKTSVLYGTSFGDFDLVVAGSAMKATPLKRGERSKFLRAENDYFEDGPAGTWRPVGATTGELVDPSCGTFNEGHTDKGQNFNHPSGRIMFVNDEPNRCVFNYGQWINYNRPQQQYSLYTNLTHQTTDWLELQFQVSLDNRMQTFITETISPVTTGFKTSVIVPENHPANPFGQDVRALAVRFFGGGSQGAEPSYVKNGSQWNDYTYLTDRVKFKAAYDIVGSWVGETSFTHQQRRRKFESYEPLADHVIAALQGFGGPNGDEWFNPFLSYDPRSPDYIAGVTDNSVALIDWMMAKSDNEIERNILKTFDSHVTGEIMDLPAGPAQLAFGVHIRESIRRTEGDVAASAGNNVSTGSIRPRGMTDDQLLVRSVFGELEIPILDNLSVQLATRFEKFETIDLRATTPKIAVRYEPIENLAFRYSWGEGFLAPQPGQKGPIVLTQCTTERDGSDPITGITLLGVESCNSSNPDLGEERSELKNFGFTWEGIENLSISVDYQKIKFDGRIVSPDSIDLVNDEFTLMLRAIGKTPGTYDITPGSADRLAAEAYLQAHPNPLVTRDPITFAVISVIEVPENVESVNVEVFDVKARYNFNTDYGQFALGLQASYIDVYELDTLDGLVKVDGVQNGETGKAPPLPKLRYNLSLDWLRGQHTARATVRYTDDLIFSDRALITRARVGLDESFVVRPTKIDDSYQMDVHYTYVMDSVFGFGSNVVLGVNINNVFDWEPMRLPIPGGFESRVYDPFGRTFSLSVDFTL